jgi:hypothetical protein
MRSMTEIVREALGVASVIHAVKRRREGEADHKVDWANASVNPVALFGEAAQRPFRPAP